MPYMQQEPVPRGPSPVLHAHAPTEQELLNFRVLSNYAIVARFCIVLCLGLESDKTECRCCSAVLFMFFEVELELDLLVIQSSFDTTAIALG